MQKLINIINIFLRVMIAAIITVMAMIVAANVISRYIFHFSLTWSAELAEYCMVWAAFLGAAYLVNQSEHLVVDLLEKYLKGKLKRYLQITILSITIVFFGAVTYYGSLLVLETKGQVASSMRFLPMNIVYSIMPISGLIMLIGV